MRRETLRATTLAALGVLLLALAAATSAIAAPTITEYSLSAGAAPLGIVTGADGNLWFAQSGGGSAIDSITPAGLITSYPVTKGSAAPSQITLGPDGKLWFTEVTGGIGTFAPPGGAVSEYSPTPPHMAIGIVSGPEGDLWFTGGGAKATIGRVVPATGVITEFKVPTELGAPTATTVGPEGDVWFTEEANPGAIGRFNAATKEFHEYTAGLSKNRSPAGITAGPDGNIWFTEETNPGKIGRINPATGTIEEFSAGLTVGEPRRIVTGGDGNLYFTESVGNGAIGRITTTGEVTEFTAGLTPEAEPWAVTAGPDGNIWFTEKAGAKVGRLTIVPQPPTVAGSLASELTSQGAVLSGTVNPQGESTAYHFEWGLTPSYGSQLPSPDASAGSDSATHGVSLTLTGLQPRATYHYRIVASNAAGTTYGTDTTFTTAAASSPGGENSGAGLDPFSPIGGTALPAPPVIGRLAGVEQVSGTVLVKSTGSGGFVPLGGAATVPIGSVIDASQGVVLVVTALDAHGRTQTARFWGGVFQVSQTAGGNGLTRIILNGALPTCARGHRARASSARRPQGKVRQLWAKDNHGRYRSYGAYSATTVMGTEWETVDSCAGTLTRVVHGKVRVRDLHRHKTILVRAGRAYLARP